MRGLCRALIVGAALVVSACQGTPSPSGIEPMLNDWHRAASKADEAGYFGHFTEDAIFVGTDATERWDVEAFRAYAHPHFSKGRGWTYTAEERHVQVGPGGRVAWFDERLRSEKYGAVRGSGVVRWTGQRWQLAHYVMSFPIPNDKAKTVLEARK